MRGVGPLVLALFGCGRIAFDPRSDASTSDTIDAATDAGLPAGLIAWFPFDPDFDDRVSGVATTCTTCPSPTAGHIGGAALFDGNDDCLTFDLSGSLEPARITLALWARIDTDTNASLIAKRVSTGTTNSWQIEADRGDANNLGLSFTVSASLANTAIETPSDVFSLGVWTHIAATHDGSIGRLYVDGVLRASQAHPGLEYDTRPLKIGCDDNAGNDALRFAGALDDVRIYDRALGPLEIAALAAM